MRLIVIVCFLLASMAIFAQNKYFVTESGGGKEDGSSWSDASKDLRSTVNNALPYDTVWVAAGTYYGGFVMQEGVQVYGGFSGTENSLWERKLPGTGVSQTILDGKKMFRVLTQLTDFEISTVWDGFVIQHGRASSGAGVYLLKKGIVSRSIIRYNIAGIPAVGEYLPNQGGVVFRTDEERNVGTVIATADYGQNYPMWSINSNTVNSLADAIQDMDGEYNTEQLSAGRAAQVIKNYRAEGIAGLFEDWYIPSAGEWSLFVSSNGLEKDMTVYQQVEESLLRNNKTPLAGNKYWSSTSAINNGMPSAWYINFSSKDINPVNIFQYNRIRGARSFHFTTKEGKGGGVFATSGSKIMGSIIMQNEAGLGGAICARGDIDIINNTVVGNRSASASSAIDANSSVKVLNTIVTTNVDENGDAANLDSRIAYQYSAIESYSVFDGNNNVSLGSVDSPTGASFVDATNHDYRLTSHSPCLLTGNREFIPDELDSDLQGLRYNETVGINIGAFGSSFDTGIKMLPLSEVNIYPVPVKVREPLFVELNKNDLEGFVIELRNTLGVVISSARPQQMNRITAPGNPGMYILCVIASNNECLRYKILVTE